MFTGLFLIILLLSISIFPIEDCGDRLIWNHNSNGELSLNDAYNFKRHEAAKVQWAPLLWCKDIPPSKSLLAWRLIHDKVPTDEKLAERGLHFPSMCSLCYNYTESTFHLFFECTFAYKLWCWLASIVNFTLQFQSIIDIRSLCNRGWSPQGKIVVQASIANIISKIWYSRNQSRFRDVKPNWRLAINSIIYAVTLSGNNSLKPSKSSVSNLVMLKKFDIIVRPPKPPDIIEVFWSPPLGDWIKCNTDGSSSSSSSSCGGIFRDSNSVFLLCFAENLGGGTAFHAEISTVMRSIELAYQRRWKKLWIETDSSLVILAASNMDLVPCALRNRWKNCLAILRQMQYIITHIYREGNNCAEKLAFIGLSLQGITIWLEVPNFLNSLYGHDRLELPNFRFVNC